MANESKIISTRYTNENLKRLLVYLRSKYVEPIRLDYDERDEYLLVSYYDPGVSKRISAVSMKPFADDRISEIARILNMNTSELRHVPKQTDKLWTTYIQIKNNREVYGAFISVEVQDRERGENKSDIVQVYGNYLLEAVSDVLPSIDIHVAKANADREYLHYQEGLVGKVVDSTDLISEPRLTYYPGNDVKVGALRLVYLLEYKASKYFVDALTGNVVGYHSSIAR